MIRRRADRAVGQSQVHAPGRTKHGARGLGFGEPFFDRPVAAHLTRRQIAEPDAMTERGMLGDDPADADLDVVRVRPDGQHINRGDRHRVQPNTSSALSSSPRAARARMRAARNAPASVSPELPSANRCRG